MSTNPNLPQQLFNTKTQQFVNTSGQSQQQIPQNHIDALRNNPKLREAFDSKYGAGSSDQYLK